MANLRGAVEIISHSFFLQKCINRDKSSENPELYSRSGRHMTLLILTE